MLQRAPLAVVTSALALGIVASRSSERREVYGEHEIRSPAFGADSTGCMACHEGIEDMHPEADLTCVDCHGGDGAATLKLEAHPEKPKARVEDERVAPLDRNLLWLRFKNPMDLRIVDRTCATCHETEVDHLFSSLHGTTAGHLSDGFYEMGLFDDTGSRYGVFPVRADGSKGARGTVEKLLQVPSYQSHLDPDELKTHYTDLPRKECMQCHLWSQGRGVRGRVGFDGDYRGEGCAACHVEYAIDGLSETADAAASFGEPGHPRFHRMTRAPSTETCTSCHYGDASIGLHFRGLSQLPPDTPGGPEIPGTTDKQLNRVFYLNDPAICPPDVHHERGMHCIDCHTAADVMGDGQLYGQMEYAVEVSCEACHGTFTRPTQLVTERGTPLDHLRWEDGRVLLTSKVTGKEHVVPQAVHVLDAERPEYNPRAVRAMAPEHENIECYTCHAGWNVNFLGFHFSRLEHLTQLDLISGGRTPGRVTTQEKVFATWKSFYAGLNERGAVAPYLTGFSTMGSVWGEDGEILLDQVMPETSKGLSGMAMVHHQLHSTRPTARSCVECHRTSTTWGMGSPNFQLARQLAFVADRRGIEVIGIDRAEPARSVPLCKVPLPDVVDLAPHCDPLQGHAHHLYAAEGGRGIHVLDVQDPTSPRTVAFHAMVNPRNVELVGDLLYVADGVAGVKILDVSEPEKIHQVGHVPTVDAHDVDVRWPWAYVADGPGGLAILDVRAPIGAQFVTSVNLRGPAPGANEATLVESLFQYSRPMAKDDVPVNRRVPARNIATVVDRSMGLFVVDVTEPTRPQVLFPSERALSQSRADSGLDRSWRGLALRSQVDPAEAQGGERTAERDYAYLLVEQGPPEARRSYVLLFDVSDPVRVRPPRRGSAVLAGYASEHLTSADFYNPPFRQRVLFTPGDRGVYMTNATTSREPTQMGLLPAMDDAYVVAVEEFPLDRMIDESGARLKDISHGDSRWLYRAEVASILDVTAEELRLDRRYKEPKEGPGATARMHLQSLDRDGDGFLVGDEYQPAGGEAVDVDGDGRISLSELAKLSEPADRSASTYDDGAGMSSGSLMPLAIQRTQQDGDLAKLLDRVNPLAFDRNKDDWLSRKEMTAAFFAALDLDGNERLSLDELSRYPGSLRELRYKDRAAKDLYAKQDRNRDGKISQREFKILDDEWAALDADGDKRIRLLPGNYDFERSRGFLQSGSEWPIRRETLFPLPPVTTSEAMYAAFDTDSDRVIRSREMVDRSELFALLDRDGNAALSPEEIERAVNIVNRGGVDVVPDDFLGRWDLDGSGEIEADELPRIVLLRLGLTKGN